MSFGETLIQIRKERNISQMDLAEQLGVTRQTISRWETGAAHPSTEKLILLAQVLQVSLDTLTNGKTENSDAGETPEEKVDVQSLREEGASVPQRAESDSPKSSKGRKTAITCGVIALIILIFGVVIGTIWANYHNANKKEKFVDIVTIEDTEAEALTNWPEIKFNVVW